MKQRWDNLSDDQIRRLQDKKLDTFIRRQARFAPFYREDPVWSQKLSEFESRGWKFNSDTIQELPFTTKNDYLPTLENPAKNKDFILQPTPELIKQYSSKPKLLSLLAKKLIKGKDAVLADLRQEYAPVELMFTTGRSADSVAFALTQHDMGILKESGRRICEVLEIDPTVDRGFNLFPYVPHLGFWQAYYAGISTGMLTLNSGGGKCLGTQKIIRAIDKIKPSIIFGVPGYTYHVMRTARDRGLDWSFVKLIAMGGEKVSESLKVKLREIIGSHLQVSSVLGMTESKHCWAECVDPSGDSHGFHTYPDMEFFEIIDPKTGQRLPEGHTGELVYTSMDARGSIMLRYRTGDLVDGGMRYGGCPGCGRNVPRISIKLGRVSNVVEGHFEKIKGAFVNFNLISETLSDINTIEEWQITLKKQHNDPDALDEMNLALSIAEGALKESVTSEVESAISQVSEVGFNAVSYHSTNEMLSKIGMETQTKETRILDLR